MRIQHNDYDVELSPEEQVELLHRIRRVEIKLTVLLNYFNLNQPTRPTICESQTPEGE